MFLHIGSDVEVSGEDIVAIINISSINNSKISKQLLQCSKDDLNICKISEDEPKSIILLNQNNQNKIYLSPISSSTLQKRILKFNFVD